MANTDAIASSTGGAIAMDGPAVVVEQLIKSLNHGNLAACLTAFADDILIVDDISPFRWVGKDEAETWLSLVIEAGQRLRRTLDIEPPARCEIARARAYLVVPTCLRMSSANWDGKADGLMTLTLRGGADSWLIDTAVWSGSSGSLARHSLGD